MKVKVFIPGTDIIKKAHKNQDYDIVVNGFNQTERIRYSKELNGETCRLKTLAECSENTAKTYICAFDTDNYGIIKHSAGVFDCGKLLGISDMTVAYSGSPYMPGAHGKLYDTKSGKIAVAIGDDLYRYELFKSFAVCGAEAVIAIRQDGSSEMNGVLLRAYSYLLGFPILLVSKDKAIASNVKGELIEPKDDVFELVPLFEFSIKTTKIKFNK